MNEMINLRDNDFINNFDNCLKEALNPITEIPKEDKKDFSLINLFKKKEVKDDRKDIIAKQRYLNQSVYRNYCLTRINDCNGAPSYELLWSFCQFIRYAEKVIFYHNTLESTIYVDSDLLDFEKRAMKITTKDTDISLILKKVENPADRYTPFKVINLEIKRHFGKEMLNKFTIVNGEVKYNDSGDIALITIINQLLINVMEKAVKEIFDMIYQDIDYKKNTIEYIENKTALSKEIENIK